MARIRRTDDVARVYSTDEGRVAQPSERGRPKRDPSRGKAVRPPDDGVVRVSRTKAGRGGKTVTLVTGLPAQDVPAVGAKLKKLCGSGGTVRDGVVEIQGDHRQRIADHLSATYTTKIAGG